MRQCGLGHCSVHAAELGRLTRLNTLNLLGNRLTGPLPPELGALSALEFAWLNDNALTGPIPREFGGLSSARLLFLANNDLSGGVPAAFGRLARLEFLNLSNNPRMIGALPPSLAALDRLDTFHAGGTAAGRPALLRVFVTAPRETGARIPPVRARFYRGGAEVHVAEIPAGAEPIPVEVREARLAKSANARIPASVVRPGLKMVIEIDPDGTQGIGVWAAGEENPRRHLVTPAPRGQDDSRPKREAAPRRSEERWKPTHGYQSDPPSLQAARTPNHLNQPRRESQRHHDLRIVPIDRSIHISAPNSMPIDNAHRRQLPPAGGGAARDMAPARAHRKLGGRTARC